MGLGHYYSRRLYRRAEYLRQADRLLEAVRHRLTYAALPMGTLWRRLAAEGALADCSLLTQTAAALEESPFADALSGAVKKAAAEGLLEKEGEALLTEFARSCGRVGLTQQAAHIAACQHGLQRLTKEAREQADARGRVYRVLGLCGGVGVSLLLL